MRANQQTLLSRGIRERERKKASPKSKYIYRRRYTEDEDEDEAKPEAIRISEAPLETEDDRAEEKDGR